MFLSWAGGLGSTLVCLHVLPGAMFKIRLNLFSLKASRSPSKINDNAAVVVGDYGDYGHSGLGLVSLITFWMV